MINYLINFHQLDPWAADRNGDTFFHLLCQNKKIEAVTYCLRSTSLIRSAAKSTVDTRSIRDLRNASGQTPFDLSLDNSTAEIPYLLLSSTEFSLLTPRNFRDAESQKPSTFAASSAAEEGHIESSSKRSSSDPARVISVKAKSNPSFAQLESTIAFHRRIARWTRRSEDRPLLGPYLAYYWLIAKPFLLPPLLFFLSWNVVANWTDYDGGFLYIVAFYFAWSYKSENYRMNHVSKWPNPFMASLFFCGIFYDILVFFVAVWPALAIADGSGLWFDVFVVTITLTLIYQYLKLVFGDSGRAPSCGWLSRGASTQRVRTTDEKSSLVDGVSESAVSEAFLGEHCPLCHVRGSAGEHVRHCRLCDVCLRGFDHHCLFLLTCVAEKNRRLFLVFLVTVNVACIPTFVFCVLIHLTSSSSLFASIGDESPTFFRLLYHAVSNSVSDSSSAALVFLCLGNAIAWSWIAYLIYNQIYFIVRSHTTSCVGINGCRDELNVKIGWRRFGANLIYFLVKGETRDRNVAWA